MTVTVTLDTSAPPDPAYLLEVARAFAESARVMAHLTRHTEAFGTPEDMERVLREISAGLARVPQVLTQGSRRLALENAASRIEVTRGQYEGRPDAAVTDAWEHFDEASAAAERAARELGAAADITSAMAPAPEPGQQG